MTDPQLVAEITELIYDTLSVEVPAPDTDLIDEGLLDSLALVSLITEIESAFSCVLPLDDFDVEQFRSVERIAGYLIATGALNGSRA